MLGGGTHNLSVLALLHFARREPAPEQENTVNSDRFGQLSRNLARTRSRRQVIAVLGGGLVAALLGSSRSDVAAQGNAQAARDCQQGGYASLVRGDGPHEGTGFETVGECVNYAAQGGTLERRLLGGSDACSIASTYDPSTRLPSLASLNLGPCDLSGLDLSGANLSYASLIGGYLPGANLTGADLTGANLYNANLNSAILRGANLSGANLDGALLAYTDLTGADLSGATLNGTIWSRTTCPDGTITKANGGTCVGHL